MGKAGEYVIQPAADGLAALGGSSVAIPTLLSEPVATLRTEPNTPVVRQEIAPLAAGLSYVNCTSSQKTSIASALSQADTYASNAGSYLTAGTVGSRYTTWFGAYTSSRYSTARTHYTAIRSAI